MRIRLEDNMEVDTIKMYDDKIEVYCTTLLGDERWVGKKQYYLYDDDIRLKGIDSFEEKIRVIMSLGDKL